MPYVTTLTPPTQPYPLVRILCITTHAGQLSISTHTVLNLMPEVYVVHLPQHHRDAYILKHFSNGIIGFQFVGDGWLDVF